MASAATVVETNQNANGTHLYANAKRPDAVQFVTGKDVRHAARFGKWTRPTFGLAPGHIQANLIVLPSRYAEDFRNLCIRNPVPCPLLAESAQVGNYSMLTWQPKLEQKAAKYGTELDIDLRTDLPAYNIYEDGVLVKSHIPDLFSTWSPGHTAFLIGCSFSFETALCQAGLTPRHMLLKRSNCPMYRATKLPLCPAGVFTGSCYVVSMRPYKLSELERVRQVTRAYGNCHGEPLAWGWDAVEKLGILDIDNPDWGEPTLTIGGKSFSSVKGDDENECPVFWGCGVTPQAAVMEAGKSIQGTVLAHAPSHMLLLDLKDEDILS